MKILNLKNNANNYKGWYSREAYIRQMDIDLENRSISNIVATEKPVIVFDWFRWEPIREILLMDGVHLPSSRQVVLLDAHSRFSNENIKGSTRELEVDNDEKLGKIIVGRSYFSETAVIEWTLVKEGHLTDTSIGYLTFDDKTIILAPGESTEYKGVKYVNDYGDDYALALRTEWELKENSLVPIGADDLAKFRSAYQDGIPVIQLDDGKPLLEQLRELERKEGKLKIVINKNKRSFVMTDEEKVKLEKEREAALKQDLDAQRIADADRAKAIRLIANDLQKNIPHIKLSVEAEKFIAEGKTQGDFYDFCSKEMKSPEAIRTPISDLGLSNRETEDYSIRNIILYQLGRISAKEVGMEIKASEELSKKMDVQPEMGRGIFLPYEVMKRRRRINVNKLTRNERDLITGTDASGGFLVQDQYIPQSFLEILENSMIFVRAGVTILTGLKGNIPMNRELDAYTHYWVGEGSGSTKSSITFGRETMSPKKGGALAQYSYEFLLQASIAVEAYVERRLAKACALGADRAIGYGSGSGAQPKGLKNWSGIGSVSGVNFNRSRALDMEGQLQTSNADDLGAMGYISRGTTRSILKDRAIDPGSGRYLVSDDNQMVGYDYSNISNQIDVNELFFGVWSNILVGYWDQVQILANPFEATAYPAGDVQVRALQALDVFVQNPGAFSLSVGIT